MGLTAHNRKRKEQAAQGLTGAVTRATAHFEAATKRVNDLTEALSIAQAHADLCERQLRDAEREAFEQLPEETKKMLRAQANAEKKADKEVAGKAPELSDFSLKELQAMAKDMGLAADGKKADLIARIAAAKAEE